MTNINRTIVSGEVKPFVSLGDGSYYYNYDITELPLQHNENEENVPMYSFVQIRCWGKPEYKDCVKQLIRTYVTQEEEFDLINSANSLILSGNVDENNIDIKKYKEYLKIVNDIKSKVKKDFGK